MAPKSRNDTVKPKAYWLKKKEKRKKARALTAASRIAQGATFVDMFEGPKNSIICFKAVFHQTFSRRMARRPTPGSSSLMTTFHFPLSLNSRNVLSVSMENH